MPNKIAYVSVSDACPSRDAAPEVRGAVEVDHRAAGPVRVREREPEHRACSPDLGLTGHSQAEALEGERGTQDKKGDFTVGEAPT
jgi:hypothetical protein